MNATQTSGLNSQQNKTTGKRVRSILKGDLDAEKEDEDEMNVGNLGDTKEDPLISSINGNIVHVTVNNFITTDKQKKQPQNVQQTTAPSKFYNARPFSSDGKDRERRTQQNHQAGLKMYGN